MRTGSQIPKPNTDVQDLPDGYKMSELGPLPEEWRVVRLGEVAEARGGVAFPHKYQGLKFGSYPFYKVSDMNLSGNETTMRRANNWIDEETLRRIGARPFPARTVIFPKVGGALYTNKKRLLGVTALLDNNLMGVTVLSAAHYLPELLLYWLETIDLKDLSNPGPLPSINAKRVKDLPIPLPPLAEQRAIAHVLRTVQQAKEAGERVVAALKELKKSLMRHLFTYGPVGVRITTETTENTESFSVNSVPSVVNLKDTELGPIPAHWQVVRLGEVVDIKGGKRLPKGNKFSDNRTPYPYIRVVDFKNNSVDSANLKFLTPEQHKLLERYIITKDDVYISIAGTIGEVGSIPPELDGAHLTENAARIILDQEKIHQKFLVFALASDTGQEQIQVRATKTSQPKLALARIKDIPIYLPPLAEQREIARILQAVDRRIAAEEAWVRAVEALFRSLLHDLMSGKRRVKYTTEHTEDTEI
jgi:type I restriction enzyme S subunit